MSKRKLTQVSIAALSEGTYWDTYLPAFGVRVSKTRTVFLVNKDKSRRVIGRHPDMTLVDARAKARQILSGDTGQRSVSWQEATERYLRAKSHELAIGTLSNYERHLQRFRLQSEHIEDVTQSQILNHLDTISGQSDRAHAARAIKTFLRWCVQREYCRHNPIMNMEMPKEPATKERFLAESELLAVWQALDTFNLSDAQHRFQYIVKLLILTGQRKNQIASLNSNWVDFSKKKIDFPASIMKARKPHTHYFSTTTHYYLSLLQFKGRFTAWSPFMEILRKRSDVPHFTPHDLRRTYATLSAQLQIQPHITERLLAHSQPEGPIAAIYNRHKYETELRAAANLIEGHILTLTTEAATIFPFRPLT